MTARRRLHRKARIAISVAVTVLLTGPVLAMRSCLSNIEPNNRPVAAAHPQDDGLIRLQNGATLFLQDGSLSRRFSEWLELKSDAQPAFEIADTNFVAGSAELTGEGSRHIAQLAQILEADPQLTAKIVSTEKAASDDSGARLELSRVSSLQAELIEQHVPPQKITSASSSTAAISEIALINDASGGKTHLFVILSK